MSDLTLSERAKLRDKLIESLKNLETHADALMKIPAGEQFIAPIQAVTSIGLLETKRAIEALWTLLDS